MNSQHKLKRTPIEECRVCLHRVGNCGYAKMKRKGMTDSEIERVTTVSDTCNSFTETDLTDEEIKDIRENSSMREW